MSKAYPSNLSRTQYEFLSDMIPEAKPIGRPREVEMSEVLNAIFYVLCEGCRWRALSQRLSCLADGVHLLVYQG
jgi:transposase